MENWNDVHITVYIYIYILIFIYTHNQHGITINYFNGIQYSDMMAKWENDEAWHQTLENVFLQATRWLSWYGVGLASADRLPVVVRILARPLGSLKCDPPKGNGRRPQKNQANVFFQPENLGALPHLWLHLLSP